MKHAVRLSAQDRGWLERLTTTGVHSARMIRRAKVLLASDLTVSEAEAAGGARTRAQIAAAAGVSQETVRLVAKRFADNGGDVAATIGRKQREFPPVPSVITGEVEARLVAMACSQPPEGFARWSLRLLEKHVALVADIPDLDHSTIGRILKKRSCVLI